MTLQTIKIIGFWGMLLLIFQLAAAAFFGFLGSLLFTSDSGHYLAIPFALFFAYFAGYKATNTAFKLKGVEKVLGSPFWSGMWVGLVAMLLDTIINYLVFGKFSFGQGILMATVAGFGGKMASK